jgi:formylglycine-generating enzyme required for sulfatase activity
VRGGSWDSPAARFRCAARQPVARGNLDPHIGVRAMRAIDPPTR